MWQQERRRIFAAAFPMEDLDAVDLDMTMANFDLASHGELRDK